MNAVDKTRDISSNLVAGLLLGLMAVLAGGAALRESVTIDEVAHIGAGVSYLQKFDLRMNAEHPHLPKVLSATMSTDTIPILPPPPLSSRCSRALEKT